MHTHTQRNQGFTLIELMIVVTIIGILAAVVIPKFSNANETAKAGSLATQIATVKKSLERYKTEHNDEYPTEDELITSQWQVLTNSTDMTGDVAGDDYGPYIMKPAMNSFMDSDIIATDNSAGWKYDESTGVIQAVVPQAIYDRAAQLQLDPNDLVVGP